MLPVLPAPPAPDGATVHTDPAGWSIAVDPAWEFRQAEDFTGWFTGTGTDGFADNVNVTLEVLPAAMTLDDYIVAAKGFISTSAADVGSSTSGDSSVPMASRSTSSRGTDRSAADNHSPSSRR